MELVTKERAIELVEAAVRRNPNARNPQSGHMGQCLYTSADGKNHCIAGQVLVDLGLDAPDATVNCSFDDLPHEYLAAFDGDAIDFLCEVQAAFDQGALTEGKCRTWQEGWSKIEGIYR